MLLITAGTNQKGLLWAFFEHRQVSQQRPKWIKRKLSLKSLLKFVPKCIRPRSDIKVAAATTFFLELLSDDLDPTPQWSFFWKMVQMQFLGNENLYYVIKPIMISQCLINERITFLNTYHAPSKEGGIIKMIPGFVYFLLVLFLLFFTLLIFSFLRSGSIFAFYAADLCSFLGIPKNLPLEQNLFLLLLKINDFAA